MSWTSPLAVDAVTHLRWLLCYIFRQMFPFQSGLKKDKICDLVTPPSRRFYVTSHFLGGTWPVWTRVFLPSLHWGREMKSPGNEVVRLSVYGLGLADLETGGECQMSTGGNAEWFGFCSNLTILGICTERSVVKWDSWCLAKSTYHRDKAVLHSFPPHPHRSCVKIWSGFSFSLLLLALETSFSCSLSTV